MPDEDVSVLVFFVSVCDESKYSKVFTNLSPWNLYKLYLYYWQNKNGFLI